MEGFGAAQIMQMMAKSDEGVEEMVIGMMGAAAPHLTTACLESLKAVIVGELSERPADE